MQHSRTGCVLKWGGTVCSVLLAGLFAHSIGAAVSWVSPSARYEVSVMKGAFRWAWRPAEWHPEAEQYPSQPGWSRGRFAGDTSLRKLHWWFSYSSNRSWVGFGIPLWMPWIILTVPTVAAWHRDQRQVVQTVKRWGARLAPDRPVKVSLFKVVAFCVVHVAGLVFLRVAFHSLYYFYGGYDTRGPDAMHRAVSVTSAFLFWNTPLWAVLWAWLYVRFRNALFRRFRPFCCRCCGYDLTGNLSGVCPECGTEVPPP